MCPTYSNTGRTGLFALLYSSAGFVHPGRVSAISRGARSEATTARGCVPKVPPIPEGSQRIGLHTPAPEASDNTRHWGVWALWGQLNPRRRGRDPHKTRPRHLGSPVTVHWQARGTDPFSRTNGASESDRVHGRYLFFAVKMRQSPTGERLRSPAHEPDDSTTCIEISKSHFSAGQRANRKAIPSSLRRST